MVGSSQLRQAQTQPNPDPNHDPKRARTGQKHGRAAVAKLLRSGFAHYSEDIVLRVYAPAACFKGLGLPPVSFLILHPREIQILWWKTVRQRKKKRG